MNENIDLTQILEGCPRGTKFYSLIFGEVEFVEIRKGIFPRIVVYVEDWGEEIFSQEGCYFYENKDVDTDLFPSKEQRDWSKFERFWDKPKVERFNPKTLHPFDKVIVRYYNDKEWSVNLFSHFLNIKETKGVVACGSFFKYCIPYNEETKHLVGTANDCPDFYKWWEE